MTFQMRLNLFPLLLAAPLLLGATPATKKSQATQTSTPKSPPAAMSTPRPASSVSAPRAFITNWPTGKKLVALTYDDGPDPRITPKLLTLLREKNVPATFYVLGERVQEYPEITRQLHEAGHEVVNHTFDHKQLTALGEEKLRWELSHTNDLITAITGIPVTHMRPPYGARNARVDAVCKDLGMKIVLWDVDTEDWRKRSSAQMTAQILRQASDGSIILFHDRYQSSLDTTAAVIDSLRERGFTFVTVGQMLAQPRTGSTVSAGATGTTSPLMSTPAPHRASN